MRPYTFSKADEEREQALKDYTSLYSEYVNFYHNELLNNPETKSSLDYLKNRKLTLETIKNFKLGYVKKNSIYLKTLKKILMKKY